MPVTVHHVTFGDVQGLLPSFARRPFRILAEPSSPTRANERLTAIVRLPTSSDSDEVPVGVVSHNYQLVQHRDVVACVNTSLESRVIESAGLDTVLSLTPNAERMALSVLLPEDERFRYKTAANDYMGLRLECFNSVDGTMKFTLAMGWLRFVCSNGLLIGKALTHIRRAHTPSLALEGVSDAISRGIKKAVEDHRTWDQWQSVRVEFEALRDWADGPLMRRWGTKSAARTFALCMHGRDIEFTDPFESAPPSARSFKLTEVVPGAVAPASTVFDIAQALSWVAGQKHDLAASIDSVRDIEPTMKLLLRRIHKYRN